MSIVNFSIPKTLEKRVADVIEDKGFSSKAEFFRYAAIYFIDVVDRPFINEKEQTAYLTKALTAELIKKYHNRKIPSLEEQLSDV